jgi:serine/threonine protein kinase
VRTDVCSLGVLLYELLVGESPYGACEGIPDLLRRVGKVWAPRVSARDPRIGAAIETVVRTAMAQEREERYRSVELMAGDVRRYLAGERIRAVPLSSLGFGVLASFQAGRLEAKNRDLERRAQELSALLAFVPDCVHVTNRELAAQIAKPGTLLDRAVGYSSPNPHHEPAQGRHAHEPAPEPAER